MLDLASINDKIFLSILDPCLFPNLISDFYNLPRALPI